LKIIFISLVVILFFRNLQQVYDYSLYIISHQEGAPFTIRMFPQSSSPEKFLIFFFFILSGGKIRRQKVIKTFAGAQLFQKIKIFHHML